MTLPPGRKAGARRARASIVVSGRGCSSRVTAIGSPRGWGMTTGHELVVEAARLDGGGRAALALEGEGVLALARHVPVVGDALGRLAEADRRVGGVERRVHEAPAERRIDEVVGTPLEGRLGLEHHPRRPAHRFHPARDEDVAVADGDRVGRRVDRLEPGAAQAVDGQPANRDGVAGQEQRHAGDVAIVLAGLVGAAEDHVLDDGRVDSRPFDDRAQDDRRKVVRADPGEGAAVAPDRGPDGIDDHGVAKGSVGGSRHRLRF